MQYKKIGVLMGGLSAEREISLKSGAAIADGLNNSGFEVVKIDVTTNIDKQLRQANIDAAFIALHGRFGEDGTIQGLLEMLRIPYTGSTILPSALAMDKELTRNILSMANLNVASGFVINNKTKINLPDNFTLPVVIKPVCEGSSVGISIVKEMTQFKPAVLSALKCSSKVLIEKFIDGTEVNVAIIDDKVLGAVEIEAHREFYDFSAKYDKGGSTHHIPPRLPQDKIDEANKLGLLAYNALGCAGVARVDLIIPKKDLPIILEVNTIPGMTKTSLLPEIAKWAGMSFEKLVTQMVSKATLHVYKDLN